MIKLKNVGSNLKSSVLGYLGEVVGSITTVGIAVLSTAQFL